MFPQHPARHGAAFPQQFTYNRPTGRWRCALAYRSVGQYPCATANRSWRATGKAREASAVQHRRTRRPAKRREEKKRNARRRRQTPRKWTYAREGVRARQSGRTRPSRGDRAAAKRKRREKKRYNSALTNCIDCVHGANTQTYTPTHTNTYTGRRRSDGHEPPLNWSGSVVMATRGPAPVSYTVVALCREFFRRIRHAQ